MITKKIRIIGKTDTEKDESLSQRKDLIGAAIDKSVKRLMEIQNRAKAARPGPWKASKAGSNVLDPGLSKPGAPYYSRAEDDCIRRRLKWLHGET